MNSVKANDSSFLKKLVFFLKLLEIRLRFVALLVIIGIAIGYSDMIVNYYQRWTRARPSAEMLMAQTKSDSEFFCPMHPFVVRETMAKCPVCGMDLVKRKKGAPTVLPEGTFARVQVSPERIVHAGVKVEEVAYRALDYSVRSFGTVEVDESRMSKIIARFPGRIEELIVNTTGAEIKKGAPLASIYSPKYLSSTLAYFQALESQHQTESDSQSSADAKAFSSQLSEGARKALERQGFTREQLDIVRRAGKADDKITLYSPISGTVLEKNVVVGDAVDEGTVLFNIADLSTLWILVQVLESDITGIKVGQDVEITTVARPGENFIGKVDLIYPTLNPENRSVKIRIIVPNSESKLKPGMYVNAIIKFSVTEIYSGSKPSQPTANGVLSVPESAVIDTGTRTIVYVEFAAGVYDAKSVKLGKRAGNYYPVLSGLSANDKVVARGSFLIDAEARLNPSDSLTHEAAVVPQPSTEMEKTMATALPYPLDHCLVTGEKLGSMGEPAVLVYKGQTFKFCCAGCPPKFMKEPELYQNILKEDVAKLKKSF